MKYADFWRRTGALWNLLSYNWIIVDIGFSIAGLTKHKQALHDIISGCLVGRE